jgi:hypothetical protein
MSSLLIVVILSMVFVGSTLSMRILLAFIERYELLDIFYLINSLLLFRAIGLAFKNFSNLTHLLVIELVWEFDFKNDEEVAVFVWRLVEGHAKTLATHHLIWLDNFALIVLYSDLTAVQMGDRHVDTGESIKQGYLLLDEQVSTFSLE